MLHLTGKEPNAVLASFGGIPDGDVRYTFSVCRHDEPARFDCILGERWHEPVKCSAQHCRICSGIMKGHLALMFIFLASLTYRCRSQVLTVKVYSQTIDMGCQHGPESAQRYLEENNLDAND